MSTLYVWLNQNVFLVISTMPTAASWMTAFRPIKNKTSTTRIAENSLNRSAIIRLIADDYGIDDPKLEKSLKDVFDKVLSEEGIEKELKKEIVNCNHVR